MDCEARGWSSSAERSATTSSSSDVDVKTASSSAGVRHASTGVPPVMNPPAQSLRGMAIKAPARRSAKMKAVSATMVVGPTDRFLRCRSQRRKLHG
jgi:hypothetical protein